MNALLVVGDVLYAGYNATAVAVFDLKTCKELTRLKDNPAWVCSMVAWQHYLLCLNTKGTVAGTCVSTVWQLTSRSASRRDSSWWSMEICCSAHWGDSFITVYDLRERRCVGRMSGLPFHCESLLVHEDTLYAGCLDGTILEFAPSQVNSDEAQQPIRRSMRARTLER